MRYALVSRYRLCHGESLCVAFSFCGLDVSHCLLQGDIYVVDVIPDSFLLRALHRVYPDIIQAPDTGIVHDAVNAAQADGDNDVEGPM